MISIGESSANFLICRTFLQNRPAGNRVSATHFTDRDGGLDRLESASVRVDDLVKDRRPPKAAALRAVLDKIINTNN
jgi:hypothetical protein